MLVSITANQNVWPRGSRGASPAASETSACLSQTTQELAIIGIRWGSHAQSSFLAPEPTSSSQPPWQKLIGRAAPPLPTSTHGNAQLPHLAKGEAPLELVVPFKGKGKLPGKWARGGETTGGEVGETAGPSLSQRPAEEATAHRQVSPSQRQPCTTPLRLPGPLTLVAVGEIPGAHTVNQALRGSGTVLCRMMRGEDRPQGRECWTGPPGALRRLAANSPP